jgi:sulfite exporter TauE/SafE
MLRRGQAFAHLGRIFTYTVLGAVFGAAGGSALAAGWISVQKALYVTANVLLLLLALSIARGGGGFEVLERAGLKGYSSALPLLRRLAGGGSGPGARFGLGLLWGLTPCGLVYGVLPVAMLSGDAFSGALVMLAFGLGTLPNLLAAGWVAGRARARFSGRGPRIFAAVVVAAFALAGLWRALFAAGPLLNGPFCLVH